MTSFSRSCKIVYGALRQPGSKPCPSTPPKRLWLFLTRTHSHNDAGITAAGFAKGQLTARALWSGRWSFPGTGFSSCLFMCGCHKDTQLSLYTLCSQRSNRSSWGLACPPAEGRQLRLVIPWTATAGFDKAALAEHFALRACFPTTLKGNWLLISLTYKVNISADATSTSLCPGNVGTFLFRTAERNSLLSRREIFLNWLGKIPSSRTRKHRTVGLYNQSAL